MYLFFISSDIFANIFLRIYIIGIFLVIYTIGILLELNEANNFIISTDTLFLFNVFNRFLLLFSMITFVDINKICIFFLNEFHIFQICNMLTVDFEL